MPKEIIRDEDGAELFIVTWGAESPLVSVNGTTLTLVEAARLSTVLRRASGGAGEVTVRVTAETDEFVQAMRRAKDSVRELVTELRDAGLDQAALPEGLIRAVGAVIKA